MRTEPLPGTVLSIMRIEPPDGMGMGIPEAGIIEPDMVAFGIVEFGMGALIIDEVVMPGLLPAAGVEVITCWLAGISLAA
jgi:hypothetical protein